ncbi:MAG TPA: flavin reductase family protein [Steroidobacteraceae bacterium]|nr:flavin reductase family protein [Steroidobacteraceae bacterium]
MTQRLAESDLATPAGSRQLRSTFALFATGITVVTAKSPAGRPVGLTVNSFSSVSLTPPLIQWALARQSGSLGSFAAGMPFAVNVLAAPQAELAVRFARQPQDKFEGLRCASGLDHIPLIRGALACFECQVENLVPAGDHVLIIGRVRLFTRHAADEPLVFFAGQYHPGLVPAGRREIAYGEVSEWDDDVWRI